MRVLMVHSFHHRRGGDTTYTAQLSRLLEAAGHEVIPFAMRHPSNDPSVWETWFAPRVDPEDPARALPRFAWNREAGRAVADLIAHARPSMVHVQHLHHHLSPSVLVAAKRAGVPVVWTVHDYELICPQGHLFDGTAVCEACRGHRYHQAIRRRCKRGSLPHSIAAAAEQTVHAARGVWNLVDRFLAPSRFLADRLIDFGVPADRVRWQPNCVVPPSAQGERSTAPSWLFAGRLCREKGVDTLIEAAHAVDAPLTVCGTGPLEAEVRSRLPASARVLGHLEAESVAAELQRAHVVAVPSIWYENFPYAVLEAQAASRAVVASAIGGIPEQICHGTDGWLVAPGDPGSLAEAIVALLADADRAEALGQAGRDRVRTLDPTRHLQAILAHYESVR